MPPVNTPMMQQYLRMKELHPDCILFFRLGDFYEMFNEDAKLASRELELTLTSRDRGKPEDQRTPMCGVPYHSADAYIARLIAKGYKVAICEQMEDPATAKGLVDRDIIRIVTPGTVMTASMLEEGRNNYICAVYRDSAGTGVCFCDISTGECAVTAFDGPDGDEHLYNELGRCAPREAMLSDGAYSDGELVEFLTQRLGCRCENGGEDRFRLDAANGELDFFVQILDAERSAGTAEPAERVDDVRRRRARVDFDGNFRVFREGKRFAQHRGEAVDLRRSQRARRAAAEMQLAQEKIFSERFSAQGDFLFKRVEIAVGGFGTGRGNVRAAAVPAQRAAERNVDVDGNGVPARGDVLAHHAQKLVRGNVRAKLQRRRIRRVARSGHIVFFHQIEIDVHRKNAFPQSKRGGGVPAKEKVGAGTPRKKILFSDFTGTNSA